MAPYDYATPFPNRPICSKQFYESGKELLGFGTPHCNYIPDNLLFTTGVINMWPQEADKGVKLA
jgi:hypothetical protein